MKITKSLTFRRRLTASNTDAIQWLIPSSFDNHLLPKTSLTKEYVLIHTSTFYSEVVITYCSIVEVRYK